MHIAVYLPLLIPLLAAAAANSLSRRLHPRTGTWVLTGAAVVLAGCSTLALGLLAATVIVRVPLFAVLGQYSLDVVHRDDPAAPWVAVGAGLALTAAAAAAARLAWQRARAILAAYREARCLPGSDGVVVLPDVAAVAFAVPGRPGRVVVSTAMLEVLSPDELAVLLAHERAHLTGRHYLFLAAAHLAAAANPLLRPVADAVGYTVERWADEHAAAHVGDRRLTARTIGKAALATATASPNGRGGTPDLALGVGGGPVSAPSLAGAGPVPRRVAALLAAPVPRRALLLAVAVAVVAASTLATLEGQQDLESLLELARAATGR